MRPTIVAVSFLWMFIVNCGEENETTTSKTDLGVLMNPDGPEMKKQAPDLFKANFETTAGNFVIEVNRDWAPNGVDRFYNLVRNGFYDEQRFFRVLPGFIVQWGMHGVPEVTQKWHNATIKDDPLKQGNTRGTVTYAKPGRGSDNRTVQLFINLGDNTNLDGQKFAAFGTVISGMDVVDGINAEYGEKPNQGQIASKGNKYLKKLFPNLDYIQAATIID
tara:strand:- start:1901 stop:2557 length:657 start_codon:yes stop_codon:yes gene_type:complete